MASVAFHLNTQVKQGDNPKLFEGCDGFPDGGQMRDFIYVDDVCKGEPLVLAESAALRHLQLRHRPCRAVPERGGSRDQASPERRHRIHSLPGSPQGRYQSFTQADLTKLRGVGYDGEFKTVAEGVADYMAWLNRA